MQTVQRWSESNRFDYQFVGDEIFDLIPAELLAKTVMQRAVASDLARLRALQNSLDAGYDTVIWLDADYLIFNPAKFTLPQDSYALGREVWIQTDKRKSRPSARIKVHNAFMMFRQGNVFLDFYADTAQRLLEGNSGPIPPQFIGPKLLTALHNIVHCPVLESAGMLSPMVVRDIVNGDGPALALYRKKTTHQTFAVNLCASLYERGRNQQTSNTCVHQRVDDPGSLKCLRSLCSILTSEKQKPSLSHRTQRGLLDRFNYRATFYEFYRRNPDQTPMISLE